MEERKTRGQTQIECECGMTICKYSKWRHLLTKRHFSSKIIKLDIYIGMSTQTDKDEIIRQMYHDSDSGLGSINQTHREATKILNNITYNDVKDFLERQKPRQFKAYRGFNSYVASEPLQELQIDLGDFTASSAVNDGFRYMFLAVDIFSKYIHCVPVKDKKPPESIRAFKEILDVIGIPKNAMSDREGSWESTEFVRLLNQHTIKHIISNSPPPFSESMFARLIF